MKLGGFVRFIKPAGVVLGVEIGLGTGLLGLLGGKSGKGASEGRANAGLRHDGAVGNAGAKPKPVKCHDDCIGGFTGVTATYVVFVFRLGWNIFCRIEESTNTVYRVESKGECFSAQHRLLLSCLFCAHSP